MKLYKLTDRDSYTRRGQRGETLWEIGKTYHLPHVADPKLCSMNVYHAYTSINLALLLNPGHANISNPLLYECKGDICVKDWGKCGCFDITPVRQLELPQWFVSDEKPDVLAMFAILVAESVLPIFEKEYPDDDKPLEMIREARDILKTRKCSTADYVANVDPYIPYAAPVVHAVYAATYMSYTINSANAANTAAYTASSAARAAIAANINIDFGALADEAVKIIFP
jgi:hypothetical protein